jgi:threonine dehydratase
MPLALDCVPTFDEVKAAAQRLVGKAVTTPLLSSQALDERAGGRILLKAETLQRTGSFKFRGAFNALASLDEATRANGVVACSSGNHAQGIAAAAAIFGVPATIVMPTDAPEIKVERTRAYGAHIVHYDRATGDRDLIARQIVERTGGVFVAPYDDPRVICGQGTTCIELIEQAAELGAEPEVVLVPCSGGGLTAGIALALEALAPAARVMTVEPAGFDDHARSFASGRREENAQRAGSVCDALLAQRPGELTFAVNKGRVIGGLTVSEAEVLAAVAYAYRELKLVVEPSGAVALAAVLSGRIVAHRKTIAVVLSGGNADPATVMRALSGPSSVDRPA